MPPGVKSRGQTRRIGLKRGVGFVLSFADKNWLVNANRVAGVSLHSPRAASFARGLRGDILATGPGRYFALVDVVNCFSQR